MGVFQSGINNILAQAGVATKFASDTIRENKKAQMEEQKAEADKKMAEAKEVEAKQKAEQESIIETQNKINEAIQMSIGYSPKELKTQQARESMGLSPTGKNPRGVSNKTFERRSANAQAMQGILTKYVQNAEFRDRLKNLKAKEISQALNKEIRGKKVLKGSEINVATKEK